jgi:CubicO group peptidase (beta-lactamase class C family)
MIQSSLHYNVILRRRRTGHWGGNGGDVSQRKRMEAWLLGIVAVIGLVPVAILGLHTYMVTTAKALHPDPRRAPSVAGSDPARQWADAVERGRDIMRTGLSEQNLPGLSVAVGVGDEMLWAEGFGWADLEQRIPVAPHHRFRIGTASTALTSAAVGVLLEKGRLTLDDEIQTYVPEFPRKESPVTLRQLMGHLSGLRNDGGDEGPLLGKHCARITEALPEFAERPLLFQPGTMYRYSSYGWILVSAAVEAAAADPFLTFMQEQIFEPLKMDDTMADSSKEAIPNRVTPYFPRYAANPRYGADVMRPIDYSCYSGASVFLSTPSDLVRFGMAINSGRLLRPATVALLQTSQRLVSGHETGYGLGWDLEDVTLAGHRAVAIGHDGDSLGGPVASLMTFRERGIVVAVTSNISYADTFGLALHVAEAFASAIP